MGRNLQIEKLTKNINEFVMKYNDLLNMYALKDVEAQETRLAQQQAQDAAQKIAIDLEKANNFASNEKWGYFLKLYISH
jgi:cobyrinic acid a,c-diamide synthase